MTNNYYGYGECIFEFYWGISDSQYTKHCQMFAKAIKNPHPFVDYFPGLAYGYDSSAIFPCSRPISVSFSKIYFNQFQSYNCFDCPLIEGLHDIELVITE
jgi:hypothetical protein